MITTTYNYQETLAASVKGNWRIEDIIGGDKRLDFSRPFMPDSLARVNSIDFLSDDEKTLLNQIRGYGYLCTFGLVEEFILPFVLDHARPQLNQDDYRTRALLQFASEEAKHIHLFKKFAEVNQAEQAQFRSVQLQALRWTYLGSAMTHPNFLATVGEFSSEARKRIEEMAPAFS